MPEMKIKPAYSLEQIVYLKTDDEQFEHMVVGIFINLGGKLSYLLRYAGEEPTEHFAEEILDKKRTF